MAAFTELWTEEGKKQTGIPWDAYPRPGMRRNSFCNLNGLWDLAIGERGDFDRTILVPFPPESLLSGVHKEIPDGTCLCYRRRFAAPGGAGRVLLHFGAVDQHARVWLNGQLLGEHSGGYDGFSFDVTEFLQPENELLVETRDDLRDKTMPYGKQRRDRGGMWYTPVSGIWQTVWMERVPDDYIRELHFSTEGNTVNLELVGPKTGMLCLKTPEGEMQAPIREGKAALTLSNPRPWSPEDPYLYEAVVQAGQDRVESYFAFRTLDIKTVDGMPRLCLNGKPYFFHGVLDQGYWSDGLWTPADPKCFDEDILAMKNLGFNTLRKHIKVEPELFYYACDRLGMVVFQDMVNNGTYHYLRDTVLPTLNLGKHRSDAGLHRDPEAREKFRESMEKTVLALERHPCVCYWTIFNEGWGQFDGQSQYESLKALDSSRFVDTASGWFACADSDVESLHVYFRPVRLKSSRKPQVVSEFGGYTWKEPGHIFNPEKSYGYRSFRDKQAFMDALEMLYREQILPAKKEGLCGAIYTQLSDVEDELNGLLTYDRAVCKVDPARMREIGKLLQD